MVANGGSELRPPSAFPVPRRSRVPRFPIIRSPCQSGDVKSAPRGGDAPHLAANAVAVAGHDGREAHRTRPRGGPLRVIPDARGFFRVRPRALHARAAGAPEDSGEMRAPPFGHGVARSLLNGRWALEPPLRGAPLRRLPLPRSGGFFRVPGRRPVVSAHESRSSVDVSRFARTGPPSLAGADLTIYVEGEPDDLGGRRCLPRGCPDFLSSPSYRATRPARTDAAPEGPTAVGRSALSLIPPPHVALRRGLFRNHPGDSSR